MHYGLLGAQGGPKFVLWLWKTTHPPMSGSFLGLSSNDRDCDLDSDRAEREPPASPSSWPLRGLCLLVPGDIVGWSVSCYLSWHSVILHGVYNCLSNAIVAGNMARRHREPGEFLGLIRLRESRLDDLDGLP